MVQKDKIIIIGDWFIDENWIVSNQELYHASQPGDVHYRLLHNKANQRIISLGGAAVLVEVLRHYFSQDKCDIIGYGLWNPEDNGIFKCALCPYRYKSWSKNEKVRKKLFTHYTLRSIDEIVEEGKCPFTIKRDCRFNIENLKIKNLAPSVEETIANESLQHPKEISTNRVIRCYEGFGGGKPHQLYRFDWVLPIVKKLNYKVLEELNNDNVKVGAIIIQDHNVGFINNECIEILVEISKRDTNKNVPWFINTKLENIDWFQKLYDNKNYLNLMLNICDYKLAYHTKGKRRWWHGDLLSRAALELLGVMSRSPVYLGVKPKYFGLPFKNASVLCSASVGNGVIFC